jgi:uncharacterized membrane protein (DUF106 family)
MDGAIAWLLNTLLAGGNGAIVALLVFIRYELLMDRARLLNQQDDARESLDAMAMAQVNNTKTIVNAIIDLRLAGKNEPPR